MQNKSEEPLENFIRKKRSELQKQFEPPKLDWSKISQELDADAEKKATADERPHIKLTYVFLQRVGGIAALFLIALFTYSSWNKVTEPLLTQSEESAQINLADLYPEIAEAESYYTRMITQKRSEIAQFSFVEKEMEEDFKADIGELGQMYEQLKEELLSSPAQEEVLDAMIINLQMRLKILNRQLEILARIKAASKPKNNTENEV